jgi:hypothetical protein
VDVCFGGKLRGFSGHSEVHGLHLLEDALHHGQGWRATLSG